MSALSPSPAAAEPKFEALLGRLEQIVAEMEKSDLALEHLLARYEEGMTLVQSCNARLAEAEQKVEILSRRPESTRPPVAAAAATPNSHPAGNEEEIQLF